ncbi:4-hydroxythreonine-4-phosphate dehydrogenase PdxA [Celeribacter indicus]|uniref:4-hydroxythreonine-4-phosphate dehydrogenase n=1 Tax=Celeribacter indicus TaxID=1208324 RepID=A0A0B5E4T2_9RHOB|nr:4-hydroxythreonine-4-phosphate dehydrogenase PdxA [Celeribacter indicus]AJE47377.1 4-hydroxythreonine-4-phosphate dehydrogenase [Celeribacter indicus]SDW04975.1 4-hydroxythreonine-4-phosphate dehydrogenase [Celeribacter indicus]
MTAPIALTCGDPAGVGPELAAAAAEVLKGELPFFLIGDPRHLPQDTAVAEITDPAEAAQVPAGTLAIMPHAFPEAARPGHPSLANAASVVAVIERAVALVQEGRAGAVCTGPVNKKVLKDGADFAFPGHTEFLAHLAGVDRVVMMLACPELRVVPVTIHIPLREVPGAFTPALLEETIRITEAGLRRFWGIERPRLAIAGLNPHAGEGGAMGREEIDWMIPLLARLEAEGLRLKGPMSADTMFHAAARAGYDVALCAYHDQALIPIKTVDFAGGVNVTLGLPFIRTSPDHGTAFDIAGKDLADPSSLIAALRMAREMSISGSKKAG